MNQQNTIEPNSLRFTVLLADDEPQNLKELVDILFQENYHIILAPNGKAAVELAIKHHPEAIVMDWDMPVMNGLEAVKVLRSSPATESIPIIMATGKMLTTTDLRLALEAGANDYIRKPFDNVEIIARVKAMINLHHQHQAKLALQQEIARREIEQINQQLAIKTQAMTAMKIRMISNGQNLNSLVERLRALLPHTTDDGKEIVTDLISSVRTKTLAINWDEFNHLFSQVHQSFFANLALRFTDISAAERKLCGLLKLNMSTKEIAIIMNQSPDSVKKTKQRLKKKLNLSNDESLTQYLLEIN